MLGSILRNALIMVGLVVGSVYLLGENTNLMGLLDKAGRDGKVASAPRVAAAYGETMVIPPGRGGQYRVDAEINGREIAMLVDTGATIVALSRRDAEQIGLAPHQLDYSGRVQTANGVARVARIMLDEISLGGITVRDVSAAVIDAPLGMSLLGMSFLSQLDGFAVEDGKLVLRQ